MNLPAVRAESMRTAVLTLLCVAFGPSLASATGKNLGSAVLAGVAIHQGDYLQSPQQKYFATLQNDSNLVVYQGTPATGGPAVWNTGTYGHTGPALAILQGDGNFVLYSGPDSGATGVLWAASSNAGGVSVLTLDDTGALAVCNGSDANNVTSMRWSSGGRNIGSWLQTSGYFRTNDYLVSPGKRYSAWLKPDGNLVVIDGYRGYNGTGAVRWQSGSSGHTGPGYASLQPDGNFVIYAGTGPSDWRGTWWAASSTGGTGQSVLQLEDTGALRVYNGSNPANVTSPPRWTVPADAPASLAPLTTPVAYLQSLQSGQYLAMNQYLLSTSKRFFLIQQADGNLVQNRGSGPTDVWGSWWSSGATTGAGTYFTALLDNGRICTYKGTDPAHNLGNIWCGGNAGPTGPYYLTVQPDGNLVVYKGTGPSNSQGYLWGTQKVATFGETLARVKAPVTFTNGQQIAIESPSVDCYTHQPGPGVVFGLNGTEYSGMRTLQTLQQSDLLTVEIVPPVASDPLTFYLTPTYQKLRLRTSNGAYLQYQRTSVNLVRATGTQATADVFVVYPLQQQTWQGNSLGVRLYSANAAPFDVYLDAYGSLCSGSDFGPEGAHAPALYNSALYGSNTPGQRFNVLIP